MKGKLKSAVELAMERLKTKGSDSEIRELPEEAKHRIAELKKEYQAKIAEKEIMLKSKLNSLRDRVPMENYFSARKKLESEFTRDIENLRNTLNAKLEALRKSYDEHRSVRQE